MVGKPMTDESKRIVDEDNMTKENEITINGETYVRKGSLSSPIMAENYTLIRTYSAGVHIGALVSRDGREVELENARRIWYWEGAASLSQMAVDGVSKPDKCKFPCEVPSITLTEAIELIPMTEKAQKSIKSVPVWKR